MRRPENRIRAGITMGDPSGIGPHIAALALRKLEGLAEFTVIGDRQVFEKAGPAGRRPAGVFRFIDLGNIDHKNFRFGKVSPEYGRACIEYLDKSLELLKNKEIDCIITCPISKEAVNLAGYKYSGHTEYFSRKTGAKEPVMMLLNNRLKISLVTRHIALGRVAAALTKEKIYTTAMVTQKALKELFSIKKPRLVVCGLNPHASDNGLIGKEENSVIKPALKKLAAASVPGIIDGPLPADIALARAAKGCYDGVLAMYHDQALIPLKVTGAAGGVNITLGLPFIRTSPLHGTAFDLAAGGFRGASVDSLVAAIKLAVKCALNQRNV